MAMLKPAKGEINKAKPVSFALSQFTAFAPTSLLMLQQVAPARTGRASASLNLLDVLGTALGTGLGGAAIALASNQGWALSTALTIAFALAGAAALAALFVTRRLPLSLAISPAGAAADRVIR